MIKAVSIEGQKYILASSLLAEQRIRVLKSEETFGVFDCYGDIYNAGQGEEGLYYEGTRFLSLLDFSFEGVRPLLLSSTLTNDNLLFTVDLTNPDLSLDHRLLPRGSVHLARLIFIWKEAFHEKLTITNYGEYEISLPLTYRFDADFVDIFELRGMRRKRHGRRLRAQSIPSGLLIPYEGLDGLYRQSRIAFADLTWTSNPEGFISTQLTLGPQASRSYSFIINCELSQTQQLLPPPSLMGDQKHEESSPFLGAFYEMECSLERWKQASCRIEASYNAIHNWLQRSLADLCMLISHTELGAYPYAGVPWFSAPFGRDGIITAWQCLWLQPALARGVLNYLATTQASKYVLEADAEPGKILHEARKGEMANLGEIPFAQYYGSVDATPLFVALAGEYLKVTGDLKSIQGWWPHILRAINWIEKDGDPDQDGFVEYAKKSKQGLINQGWKDSFDSVFHADGSSAQGPIALCEVQGYVYQAYLAVSEIASALGQNDLQQDFSERAQRLKENFNTAFWCEELGMYALALDGEKRPCRVRSSNAGHSLFSGIASTERAASLARALIDQKMFSGWGIRTIGEGEARYNPMSYHNGSVWPHDTSLIAMGFSRYGEKLLVEKLFCGLFEASVSFELQRLPELFCGFPRREGRGPTQYPMSCAPQAWAAGAAFYLLQACLGLQIDGLHNRLIFRAPRLPACLSCLRLFELQVGGCSADLELLRHSNGDLGIHLLAERGKVDLQIFR